jgi:hypothetical protein
VGRRSEAGREGAHPGGMAKTIVEHALVFLFVGLVSGLQPE